VVSPIVQLLRLASIVICLIVIASFASFAVEQTKTASGNQQEAIATGAEPGAVASAKHPSTHEGSVHKALDEASNELTSPFAGIVSGTSSEWAIRGVKLLLALLVYGFGLSYLARMLRVRV
jgi:hypothetical protein